MADDERRAEIEAVAEAIALHEGYRPDEVPEGIAAERELAEKVVAALDRVRDARGDEGPKSHHVINDINWPPEAARSPQGEDHEARDYRVRDDGDGYFAVEYRYSPLETWDVVPRRFQSRAEAKRHISRLRNDDHEAGIEAARIAAHEAFGTEAVRERRTMGQALNDAADAAVRAYLARVSPSRDGTVAVEDVRHIVNRAEVRLVHGGCNVPGYNPGTTVYFPGDDWQDLLAEFSRPEQPEPDALGGLPPSQPKEDHQ